VRSRPTNHSDIAFLDSVNDTRADWGISADAGQSDLFTGLTEQFILTRHMQPELVQRYAGSKTERIGTEKPFSDSLEIALPGLLFVGDFR
jgi:hypothetical protein